MFVVAWFVGNRPPFVRGKRIYCIVMTDRNSIAIILRVHCVYHRVNIIDPALCSAGSITTTSLLVWYRITISLEPFTPGKRDAVRDGACDAG